MWNRCQHCSFCRDSSVALCQIDLAAPTPGKAAIEVGIEIPLSTRSGKRRVTSIARITSLIHGHSSVDALPLECHIFDQLLRDRATLHFATTQIAERHGRTVNIDAWVFKFRSSATAAFHVHCDMRLGIKTAIATEGARINARRAILAVLS